MSADRIEYPPNPTVIPIEAVKELYSEIKEHLKDLAEFGFEAGDSEQAAQAKYQFIRGEMFALRFIVAASDPLRRPSVDSLDISLELNKAFNTAMQNLNGVKIMGLHDAIAMRDDEAEGN